VIAYRVAQPGKYPVFSGDGARLKGGRWNSPGQSVIYACLSYGTTLLEQLVHLNGMKFPRSLRYVKIEIPDVVSREDVDPVVIHGWDAQDMSAARLVGDQWIASVKSAVLIVPSVPAPLDRNIVINTKHPDFANIVCGPELPVVTDPRLVL
jgi:RES domain-containing protein